MAKEIPKNKAASKKAPKEKAKGKKASREKVKSKETPPQDTVKMLIILGVGFAVIAAVLLFAALVGRGRAAAGQAATDPAPEQEQAKEKPLRPGSVRFEGRDYRVVFDDKVNWHQARQAARQAGGDLAIVDTRAKREFLFTHTGKNQLYVGGLRDGKGVWQWVDGSLIPPEAWAPGRPDNFGSYTVLFPNLGLGDGMEKIPDSKGYIIEWRD